MARAPGRESPGPHCGRRRRSGDDCPPGDGVYHDSTTRGIAVRDWPQDLGESPAELPHRVDSGSRAVCVPRDLREPGASGGAVPRSAPRFGLRPTVMRLGIVLPALDEEEAIGSTIERTLVATPAII